MGRPLNKKYFGNMDNSPTTDSHIGGEGVTSVTVTTTGNYNGEIPTVSFGTPSFPEGLAAAGTVHGKAVATDGFVAYGTGYHMGNVLTLSGGTLSTRATLTITGVQTVGTPTLTAEGVAYDVDGDVKDEIWFDSTGWSTPLKIRVDSTTVGSGVATFTVIQQGVWTGPGAAPTSVTGTSTHNGPLDSNGHSATFTLTWGAWSADVNEPGDYTAVPANPVSTTGDGNNAATVNIRWGVKNVEMTENGYGYISAADAAPTFSNYVNSGSGRQRAVGTSNLTEAYDDAIVAIDLSTGKVVDIVKQESTDSYWVETDTLDVVLLGLAAPTDPIGLYIRAVDSSGKYYWVKSLKAHLAVLGEVTGGGEFTEDAEVEWSFDAAEENVSVQVRSAI
jgi:hypothetical protein